MTEPAAAALSLARSRPPTLGGGRLICVDGPAGSGKTTLASRLLTLAPEALVVHMDDLYRGWEGLPEVDVQLQSLLQPLSTGQPGTYRRWDWDAGTWAEQVTVEPNDLLVIEGVGAGSRATATAATVLVWVEATYDVRIRRGLDRDGEAFAPHWESWARAEAEHFARHGSRDRADLIIDGETGSAAVDQRP